MLCKNVLFLRFIVQPAHQVGLQIFRFQLRRQLIIIFDHRGLILIIFGRSQSLPFLGLLEKRRSGAFALIFDLSKKLYFLLNFVLD